ncbi:hypothetical protein PHJA_000543200 [Phtheirospermum japonicum]|uniref:Uncharacterized protein n=1 Tax=Phtheirospermum japonicum TaxID=374723 RepID=A0A830BAG7_9LAMI|nr:hypothetical protein PHJA_000543200 [Phtheirospermum japonicum]
MEALLELDDDIFYKDLSKQISLLIMDDDDDEGSLAHCPSVNLEVFNHLLSYAFTRAISPVTQGSILNYEHRQTGQRESKGTGVFIPRSSLSHSRRKNVKQARGFMANKSRRPCEHNSKGLRKISYSDNINNNPSHDHYSVNLRRF